MRSNLKGLHDAIQKLQNTALSLAESLEIVDEVYSLLQAIGDAINETVKNAFESVLKKDRFCQIKMLKRTSTAILAMAFLGVISFVIIFIVLRAERCQRQLELVHVVMRHGARTPVSTYPNDPYINDTLYPTGWGQLTNEGKLHLYNIGRFLRERYSDYLGTHYSPDIFYTQSTDTDRTKASMQLVNAGLWPPEPAQQWGPLEWQPVPIYAEPLDEDMLLLVRKPCAQYHIERDRVIRTEEVQRVFQQYAPLFEELTEITGQNVTDFDGVQDIFSTLRAEEAYNLTLPEWSKSYYPDKMWQPTAFSFVLNAYNEKLNRLKGGVFLKKILSDWRSKVEGTLMPEERKAFLYGGHDSTISNLMSTLKVWDAQMPDYGITVLLELSRDLDTDQYGVELTVPGCDSFCPLEKLMELTEDVVPQDWEEECRTDDESYVVPTLSGP
ncbi:hypothetical protein NQ318_005756 [Aromia moschata]|uniref:Prostatic acid phosphatase n=1 Tax=Aromia moschata TaxID=1265417 RepID=A0AAV8YRV8_9CUCU|nr:hypothetical protein NQ318_005756 [Aromia moschata]